MDSDPRIDSEEESGLAARVRGAVFWRSGSQIAAQLVTWAATFLVIRMLDPRDYGIYAMTQVVLVLLNLMNGYGFASALVRGRTLDPERVRQVFGVLLLLNGTLAAAQFLAAPLAASYFRHPEIADLLRVQALLYFSTPFIALPSALLSRKLEFRRQAAVNLVSAAASAATALVMASEGFGVWTLVAAPLVLWWTRALGMTLAAGGLVRPSFRFAGAGQIFGYGGAMVAVQFCWFIQSQADIIIAGRMLPAHELGIYTTALFLTQILAAKFVPPLNEVAFAAYARIEGRPDRVGSAFLKAVRLIMLVALPFYLGLAVAAEPLIATFLGPKWTETGAIVPMLAVAMAMLTLQILFAPATNALGRPGIALRTGLAGAVLMPAAFLIGLRWGIVGMSWAWIAGTALLTAFTIRLSLPAIGVGTAALARAVGPGLGAALAMAGIVAALDPLVSPLAPQLRLFLLVVAGACSYCVLLLIFAREVVAEVTGLLSGRGGRRAAAQAV